MGGSRRYPVRPNHLDRPHQQGGPRLPGQQHLSESSRSSHLNHSRRRVPKADSEHYCSVPQYGAGMKRSTRSIDQNGLTLVEVCFAILLFFLGFLPIIRLAAAAIQANSYADNLSQATSLAQSKLDGLLAMSHEEIFNAASASSTVCAKSTDCYVIDWEHDYPQIPPRPFTAITVTVSWSERSSARSISLSSIKGN
jgi:Tfp pilus assembly protein PilV